MEWWYKYSKVIPDAEILRFPKQYIVKTRLTRIVKQNAEKDVSFNDISKITIVSVMIVKDREGESTAFGTK